MHILKRAPEMENSASHLLRRHMNLLGKFVYRNELQNWTESLVYNRQLYNLFWPPACTDVVSLWPRTRACTVLMPILRNTDLQKHSFHSSRHANVLYKKHERAACCGWFTIDQVRECKLRPVPTQQLTSACHHGAGNFKLLRSERSSYYKADGE